MRSASSELGELNTMKDEAELKRQITNGILKQAKAADKINWKIPDKAKGMLIERIQQGRITSSDPTNVLETTVKFLKEMGLSERENQTMNNQLLDKSGMDIYKEQLNEIVEAVYSNADIGLDITTREFYDILKELRVPLARYNTMYRRNYAYYPELANTVINRPVADLIRQQSPNILNTYQVDILTNVLEKTQQPAFSMDTYASTYRDMLETISGIGQMDNELFK